MFYEPRNGHGLPHDPFKAIVAAASDRLDIEHLEGGGGEPGALLLLQRHRLASAHGHVCPPKGEKDSLTFIRETGEFVANLVGARSRGADEQDRHRRAAGDVRVRAGRADARRQRTRPRRRVSEKRWPRSNARMTGAIHHPKGLDGKDVGEASWCSARWLASTSRKRP